MSLAYNIKLKDSELRYLFQLFHSDSNSSKANSLANLEGLTEKEIDLLLSIVRREALREKTPNLQELHQIKRSLLEQVNPEKGGGIGQDANDSKLK